MRCPVAVIVLWASLLFGVASFFPSFLAKAVHTKEWEPRAVIRTTDCSAKSWPGPSVSYTHLSLAQWPASFSLSESSTKSWFPMILSWFTWSWLIHFDSSAGINLFDYYLIPFWFTRSWFELIQSSLFKIWFIYLFIFWMPLFSFWFTRFS